MDRKGYLLIEIIFALALFGVTAGVVTNGFLIGLRLREKADTNRNEAVVTTMLINRINRMPTSNNAPNAPNAPTTIRSEIEMHFGKEKWRLKIAPGSQYLVGGTFPKLFACDIKVAQIEDFNGNKIASPEEKEYHIFRHIP
ncbi:MAG: hypothetical protein LBR92_02010 [Puniceicoccales bacterium]|jgi:type II secretory pathway pseudopilin PulG|nr:hypothetical protein [Puniceicoccales bacterium]